MFQNINNFFTKLLDVFLRHITLFFYSPLFLFSVYYIFFSIEQQKKLNFEHLQQEEKLLAILREKDLLLSQKDELISTHLLRSENVVSSVNADPNILKYYAITVTIVVIVGAIAYFYFKNNSGPSEPTFSSGINQVDLQTISVERTEILNKLNELSQKSGNIDSFIRKIDENSEKIARIDNDFLTVREEREEILNKLNDMSEKSNGIGSIETKIEELYDYLTDPASTAENVKITEKINTLTDQQAVINAGMKQVMSSNLGFIEGTKRVFGELTTDRFVLSTTLKELSNKQTQLEINQHDLSRNQNDIEIAHGIMRNDTDFHRQNIAFLNHHAQNCSDQLLSINESCVQIIKLIGEHSS